MLASIRIGTVALLLLILGCVAYESRASLRARSWREAPLELLAFFLFSICVILLDFGIGAFAPRFHEDSIQYTGWVGSTIYMFGAIMAWAVCTKRHNRGRVILIGYLGVFAAWEAIDFGSKFGERDFDNPYLRISPYRPIWTVALPLFWMLILLSPRVRRYCTPTTATNEVRPC